MSVFFSAMIFALHPIHSEAVAGIVGRADILSGIFFLLALLAFKKHQRGQKELLRNKNSENPKAKKSFENNNIAKSEKYLAYTENSKAKSEKYLAFTENSKAKSEKYLAFTENPTTKSEKYLALTIFFATCAMFSKEQGVTVLGVCFVMEFLKMTKNISQKGQNNVKYRTLICLVMSTIGLLTMRGQLMGFSPPQFAKADNPASASDSFLARFLTLAFLPAFNGWLMLCPSQLSFDWSMDAIPLIKSWSDPRNVLSAVFYAGLLALAYRARKV